KDEYLILKEKQDNQFEKIKSELVLLEDKMTELDHFFEKDVLLQNLRICLNKNVAPIEEILKLFIKRIEFDSKENIEITFTFEDYLKKTEELKERLK
ncbi:MAG: hypothetical protein PHE78_08805, partial [Candidatus Gastranaerophilales bacterium]|nr:hypothetical protein [Candidatus Gastranaerophilales bacterium]